jgi:hypothetical protein
LCFGIFYAPDANSQSLPQEPRPSTVVGSSSSIQFSKNRPLPPAFRDAGTPSPSKSGRRSLEQLGVGVNPPTAPPTAPAPGTAPESSNSLRPAGIPGGDGGLQLLPPWGLPITQPGPLRGRFGEKIASRQRPTLPRTFARSTIGAEGLNCRVRNGNGCFPLARATGKAWNSRDGKNFRASGSEAVQLDRVRAIGFDG